LEIYGYKNNVTKLSLRDNCFINMDAQLIIVILIGIAVAVKLGYEIFRFFFVKRESSYCNGCSMCEIKKKKTA